MCLCIMRTVGIARISSTARTARTARVAHESRPVQNIPIPKNCARCLCYFVSFRFGCGSGCRVSSRVWIRGRARAILVLEKGEQFECRVRVLAFPLAFFPSPSLSVSVGRARR